MTAFKPAKRDGDSLDQDRELLDAVLERELADNVRASFEDMEKKTIDRGFPLSAKQRAWAQAVLKGEKYDPEPDYENLISSGRAPRGREVELKLGPLPKKPPPRREDD